MRKGFEGASFLLETIDSLPPRENTPALPTKSPGLTGHSVMMPGHQQEAPPLTHEGSLLSEHRLRWHSSFGSLGGEPSV